MKYLLMCFLFFSSTVSAETKYSRERDPNILFFPGSNLADQVTFWPRVWEPERKQIFEVIIKPNRTDVTDIRIKDLNFDHDTCKGDRQQWKTPLLALVMFDPPYSGKINIMINEPCFTNNSKYTLKLEVAVRVKGQETVHSDTIYYNIVTY